MANNVKEYSELKKRAMLAKQRMRMGYWQQMSEQKNTALYEAGGGARAVKLLREMQHAKIERDINKTLGCNRTIEDEALYEKVCGILDNDEDVTNPIGLLVDKALYEAMDEFNRQKYILELSKKFREMRERYYREKFPDRASI